MISVVKEINVPRLPSLRGLLKSKSAAIPIWSVSDLDLEEAKVGLSGSATRVIKVFFPQRVHNGEIFQGDLESQADSLLERLRESKIL